MEYIEMSDIVTSRLETDISLSPSFQKTKLGIQANVILVYGPPGAGKTYTITSLLAKKKKPYWVVDSKQFSETGYQGKNIVDIFSEFWVSQNFDDKKVESGVVIFDEFDKLKSNYDQQQRDVSGLGVQQSLLKLIDGVEQLVSSAGMSRLNPDSYIDTGKITYILIGAFDYLKDYYGLAAKDWKQKLVEKGFLGELIDRISYIEYLPIPSNEELKKSLIEKQGLLYDVNKILKENGINLKVNNSKKCINQILFQSYGEQKAGSYRLLISFLKIF